MRNDKQIASIIDSYRISKKIAGKHSHIVRRSVVFFFIAFLAEGVAFTCFYPFMQAVYDKNTSSDNAFLWLGVMFFFGLIYSAARWSGHDIDFTRNIATISHNLRIKLGSKLRTMPLEKMYKYRTGELNALFSSGVEESVLYFGVITSLLVEVLVVPITVVAITFFYDWRLALIITAISLLAIPLYLWKRRASVKEKAEISAAHAVTESDIVEYTQGLAVLRSLNLTGEKAEKLQESLKTLREVQSKGQTAGSLPSAAISALVQAAIITVVAAGMYYIEAGSLTLPILAALLVIMTRLSEPVEIFASVASSIDIMNTSFQKIQTLLNTEELSIIPAESKIQDASVQFNDVEFTYSGEASKSLDGVSFSLPAGSLTAVVGPSGSGKTTLTKMIMRYADPQKGSIRIGGADIRSMSQTELMSNISVVFQDVYLFNDTLLNNIRMGKPTATDEEVRSAAKAAFCEEFITRLPEGYLTKIGDIGGTLSGGERQRISIARAILKNAPIVILDEPTAALDTQSEAAVQKAIDSLVHDKTVIVIAHRLSTVTGADNILVIEDGKLTEQGTHGQLCKNNGRYAAMWNAQQRNKQWQRNNNA